MYDTPRDLALIVLTPLLLLPLGVLASGVLSAEVIYLGVMTLGNMGHHLPGMIRAYGDQRLFERFRARFVYSPIVLLGACLYLSFADLPALMFMVGAWGLWHGLAQVYGFARIYDAKAGVSSRPGALLDRAMCLGWFVGGVVFSDERVLSYLELFWQSGGPTLISGGVHTVREVFGAGLFGVSFAWLAFIGWQWKSGRPPSLVKLGFMLSSFGFWWYCMVEIDEILLGLALFEIVHDTQYLAIVWLYNRKRVTQGGELRGFTRYLFRSRSPLILLYVLLVFGYGSLGLAGRELASAGFVPHVMNALIAFSAFLHFYYDSFIWSVSDRDTRATLSLDPQAETVRWRAPSWLGHAGRWGYFAVPILLLLTLRGDTSADPWRYVEAAKALPNAAAVHVGLGERLLVVGDPAAADTSFARALELKPGYARARSGQGYAALDLRQRARAKEAFEEAIAFDADHAAAWAGLARVQLDRGDMDAAHSAADRARALAPDDVNALMVSAELHRRAGELDAAAAALERVLAIQPSNTRASAALRRVREQTTRR